MWFALFRPGRHADRRGRSFLAHLALAAPLLLGLAGTARAEDRPPARFDCQASLRSRDAGLVEVTVAGISPLDEENPTAWWAPPSEGGPIDLGFGFPKARLTDIGTIQAGNAQFDVPSGVDIRSLGISFTVPDGGRWAFGADRLKFGGPEGPIRAYFELGADMADTVALTHALSQAPSVTMSVTADGLELMNTRVDLSGRAARDALLAKEAAMIAAKDPKVCHLHR